MTPPISLVQRSPMGVAYRTPLGVLGQGVAQETPPDCDYIGTVDEVDQYSFTVGALNPFGGLCNREGSALDPSLPSEQARIIVTVDSVAPTFEEVRKWTFTGLTSGQTFVPELLAPDFTCGDIADWGSTDPTRTPTHTDGNSQVLDPAFPLHLVWPVELRQQLIVSQPFSLNFVLRNVGVNTPGWWVLGEEVCVKTAPPLPTVSGTASVVNFTSDDGFSSYQWSGTETGLNASCGFVPQFISPGRGMQYSKFDISGHDGVTADNFEFLELFDYTFIGETSGFRYKPSDAWPNPGCYSSRQNSTQFEESARWNTPPVIGGPFDPTSPGFKIRARRTVTPSSSLELFWCSELGDTASQPVGFLQGEAITGYPVGSVPP